MKVDVVDALVPGLPNAEDAAWLARFVEKGDRPALGRLFAGHADGAYRLALRICGNAADAEDAVQVAFIEVLRQAAKYRGAASVRSWIFGFVVNSCRHKAREEGRRAAREERAATGEASPEDRRELLAALRSAVQELPDPYRIPVWLHYCEGLTSGEVADSLGSSENTVRSQLARGVEQLRGSLVAGGLSAGAAAIAAALGAAAVESAPASLTSTLAGLASGAAPAAVSAKVAAAAACFAAVLATSAALWWGGPAEDAPPPELARIEKRIREWQPRPEEKRFDEIGWARSLREARKLAARHGRPIAILALAGPLQKGRSDGGSLNLRATALSDPRVIALLNGRFVPVYYESGERPEDPEEFAERRRVYLDANQAGFGTGSEYLYFLAADGRVTATAAVCNATADSLAARLADLGRAEAGAPLVPPAPQCAPPAAPPGGLLLHLTARYLDAGGEVETKRASYHEFPAEEWVALSTSDAAAFAPPGVPKPGQTWEVDARLLYALFCPVTGNWEPEKNAIRSHALTARVISAGRTTAWVRLDGRLSMEHRFFPSKDERPVEASILGFAEVDVATRALRSLRLATEHAAYGQERFGVAVRSTR